MATSEERLVDQILDDISTVLQVEDDTIRTPIQTETSTEWPPAPPPPADVDDLEWFDEDTDLALGTCPGTTPAPRHAAIYMAVRRPPSGKR
jgi:hypothetical protein